MGIADAIKRASISANGSTAPVAAMFGEVVSESPLTVKVDNRFTIDGGMLVVMSHLRPGEHPSDHTHTTIISGIDTETNETINQAGLKQGDALVLLRMQGGQRFVVLGRV